MADNKDSLQATVHTAPADISVQHVVKMMAARGVNAVVVVEELKPIGIVTSHDVMVRVTAPGLDAARVMVGTIMSSPIVTVSEDASIHEAITVMGNHGIRRLPVVDGGGRLVMLLAMDDILLLNLADACILSDIVREQTRRSADGSPGPREPKVLRFADVPPPPIPARPAPGDTVGGIVTKPKVVPMMKRRPLTRLHFAIRAWYRQNRLAVLLLAGASVLGVVVSLYLLSFYGYKLSIYEPKDIGREILLKQQELDQLKQNLSEPERQDPSR